MAGQIDIVVTKQAQAEVDKLLVSLKSTYEEIIKVNQNAIKFNGQTAPKNPSQVNAVIKEQEKLTQQLINTEKKLQQERLKDLQLQKQREQAVDKYNAKLEREQRLLSASENLYNKVQAKLNALSNEYKALATRKELGLTLTDKEAQRYSLLQTRIQNYDKTLKAVDATMGKHQRNVGNYASGFNPLSNSINQLTREMPAFTYSVQTGFMALSNNIPIFTDAIGNAVRQNKELIAQGQPTTSVLKQVAGALLSWQTLMGVGITLLTVYGKEIGNLITGTSKLADNFDLLGKSIEDYKNNIVEINTTSEIQYNKMNKLVAVAKDLSKSDEERRGAVKELKSLYPGYLRNLTDEEIMLDSNVNQTQNYIKAMRQLKSDILARVEAEAKLKKGGETLKLASELEQEVAIRERFNMKFFEISQKYDGKYLESQRKKLDEEIKLRVEKLNEDESFVSKFGKIYQQRTGSVDYIGQYLDTQITQLSLKAQELRAEYQNQKEDFQKMLIDTSLLDFKPEKETQEKNKKAIKDLFFELEDYLASRYTLTKATLEQEISMYSALYEDEKQTLDNRLFAYDSMTKKKIELAELTFEEEKRLNKLALDNNIATLTQEYNEYIKTEGVTSGQKIKAKQELNNALQSFSKKNALDLELIELKHSQNIVEITKNMFENILKIREHYSKLSSLKDINEEELRGYQEYALRLNNITKSTTLKRLNEIDKIEKDVIRKAQVDRLQLEIDGIAEKLQKTKSGSEEELKLKTELYEKTKQLTQLEINDLKEKEKAQRDYIKLLSDTYQGFINDFANQSGFSGLVDIMSGGLDKFKGDAVATALVVSEAFQEAFNTISQMSQANYENMYRNLEQQRDVAILFAGESTTAREEIERQYEERRKRIQRQQAESQKKLAIFNAVIDTAQGVVGAIARADLYPYNFVLAGIIGALGAAQIAVISSQPVPAFWTGTDNAPEGWALTQEKGREIITDKNGNIKSLGHDKGASMTYLQKGDKVLNNDDTLNYLNKILLNNGIQGISQRENTNNIIVNVETKDNYDFRFDEGEIRKTIIRGTVKTQILNSRLRIKSKDV